MAARQAPGAPDVDAGARAFARFAYPPNALGYCGPDDPRGFLEELAAGGAAGLRAAAQRFAGAWPYLQLIAGANHVADPLSLDVVEAYWVGNALLEHVRPELLAASLEERFRRDAGQSWTWLRDPLLAGAVPHHNFHVFAVYPWVGLLRTGTVDEPLRVLDRCRIRWGRIESLAGDRAVVVSRPLQWVDGRLRLGPPRAEDVVIGDDGLHLVAGLRVGDCCALHWDWVCDRLSKVALASLRSYTQRQLDAVNACSHPAPAYVLG